MHRRAVRIAMAVLAVIAVAFFVAAGVAAANLRKLRNMAIEDVDISGAPDGEYLGSYRMFPVDAEVKVTIRDQRIVAVDIVSHGHGRGAPAESITARVVNEQGLQVDAVSGATFSSKVILKAIEEALKAAAQR